MNPKLTRGLRVNRPNSQVFQCGLASESAQLLWIDAGDRSGLLRYFERSAVEHLENHCKNIEPKPTYNIAWVSVRPTMDVLFEARVTHVDYFSLDVEGGEMAILRSIDFTKVTIDVFTIEDNTWSWIEHRRYLEPLGYRLIGSAGADGFFVHSRLLDRLSIQHGTGYLQKVFEKLTPPMRL